MYQRREAEEEVRVCVRARVSRQNRMWSLRLVLVLCLLIALTAKRNSITHKEVSDFRVVGTSK
jgi:hypothetical protein